MTPNRAGALTRVDPVDRVDSAGIAIESAFLVFSDDLGRECRVYAARCAAHGYRGASPVVIHLPGGTQTVAHQDLIWWARRGFACASFDWQIGAYPDHDPARKSIWPEGTKGQCADTADTAQAVMPLAIRSVGVLIDWLTSWPAADAQRIGLAGISWGGYLTWAAAAWESRVRALVPVYGCGGLFEPGHPCRSPVPQPLAEHWARWWDPFGTVDQIVAPVCFLSGTNDFFGIHDHAHRLLTRVGAPHRRSLVANANHHLSAGESALALAWMRQHLADGPPVPPAPIVASAGEVCAPGATAVAWWWTPGSERGDLDCWWPGTPPAGVGGSCFARATYADGSTQTSAPMTVAAAAGDDLGDRWPDPRAGFASQWGMSSTQFHRDEFTITDLGGGRGRWTVERAGAGGLDVVFRGLADPRWNRDLAGLRIALDLPDPAPTRLRVDIRLLAGEYAADLPRRQGVIAVDLADFPGLPPNTAWSAVRALRLTGSIAGNAFTIGPIERLIAAPGARGGRA
ncbi:MAG: dienelactone hydrolase family protein [Planctomycetes bacterium]|nr:dienelactone hydrolase family protein [Planctomycetota bacterium]